MFNRKLVCLLIIALVSTGFMAVLYLTSERQIHYENPFQRRFIVGSGDLVKQMELHTGTLYFAGTDGKTLYLGDSRAPLQIFAVDTLLKTQRHFTIQLDNENYPFKRVEIRVSGPHFYLFDGTVPVIFRGLVSDWKAQVVMHQPEAFFLKAEVVDSTALVFKNYHDRQRETVLGRYNIDNGGKTIQTSRLLQKQIDGLFDVDGLLQVDPVTKNIVYLYYYRNQFTVTDRNLNLLYRGNTIDTNTIAKLKVSYNKQTGKRQLASPGIVVNRVFAIHNNRLFVNSNVPGKHENKNMWDKAAIVDVYDIKKKTYLSSFYVHNIMDAKLRDMLILNSKLYILVGNQINQYHLSKQFNNNKKQG